MWLSPYCLQGALDDFEIGDYLEIDLGDAVIEGYSRGFQRVQVADMDGRPLSKARWYIVVTESPKKRKNEVPEVVSRPDYPSIKIRKHRGVR